MSILIFVMSQLLDHKLIWWNCFNNHHTAVLCTVHTICSSLATWDISYAVL